MLQRIDGGKLRYELKLNAIVSKKVYNEREIRDVREDNPLCWYIVCVNVVLMLWWFDLVFFYLKSL